MLSVGINTKINNLTVIEESVVINYPKENSAKRRMIKARCTCGSEKYYRYENFIKGMIKSCGCKQYELKEIIKIGSEFGRLTVTEDLGRITLEGHNSKARYYKCSCECGNFVTVQSSNLKSKSVQSCGCLQSETSKRTVQKMIQGNIQHGDASRTSKYFNLYSLWLRIRGRCNNPDNYKYKWYGAKGIRVCSDWDSYSTFKEWALSTGYKEGLTIDRIDVTKDYSPCNCQWLTAQENIDKEYTIDRDIRNMPRGRSYR